MKLMVRYMYWACRRGERVLARVLAVGSSCRTGVLFFEGKHAYEILAIKTLCANEARSAARARKFTKVRRASNRTLVHALAGVGTLARTC